ncbi:MAG: molybdopterin-dependent oxidoreductase [Deltaproteobacteria bacterium]|nr:molybdopterin-dependent oxidoreductase [Deltaproteobacteria bacterium]
MRTLEELPVFPSGRQAQAPPEGWTLQVDGLVSRPCRLTLGELRALGQEAQALDFTCLEGWQVQDLHWEGVPLRRLLEHVGPLPEARYVTLHSGRYVISVLLEEALRQDALLAIRLNNAPLPPAHGAPLRFVLRNGECFASVKWLERIELASTDEHDTGRQIALGRIQAKGREPAPTPGTD